MTLNTYIAGEPSSGHALADFFTSRADAVHDKATGWHDARTKAEAEWEGPASEAFIANRAAPNARDADALAEINRALAPPFTAWCDGITAAKQWMDQAKQIAHDGELTVLSDAIYPPEPLTATPPSLGAGRLPGADSAAHAQATAEYQAAKALHAKKQAAFDEAKALVQQARDLERNAHDELRDALTRQTEAIKHLGQFQQWSQAAASATTPAAVGLMTLATDLENKSVNATRTAFEKAAAQNPHATNSMWSVLTSEQRADLISRYPQMVGSTNGVPVVDRDLANRSILAAQKSALIERIRSFSDSVSKTGAKGAEAGSLIQTQHELNEALDGLERLEDILAQNDKYLLGIDSTAGERGKVIVASGNPDMAQHVLTTVPGTFSDLGDAAGYVAKNDQVLARAQQFAPNQEFAAVMWGDYTSPQNLIPHAADSTYAEQGQANLREFQDGLRATHEGDTPSHNVLFGHSYGSTVIGYAATSGDVNANDLVFYGSPGVNADHVSELGVNPNHVWSGTSKNDIIDNAAIPVDPSRWHFFQDESYLRFGMNPSDPAFGAQRLHADPTGSHGDYWNKQQSLDGLARVVAGQGERTQQ